MEATYSFSTFFKVAHIYIHVADTIDVEFELPALYLSSATRSKAASTHPRSLPAPMMDISVTPDECWDRWTVDWVYPR